jgi:membrane-associated phospholipid phosphatase
MKLSRHIGASILVLGCVANQAQAFTVNTTPLSSTQKDIRFAGKAVAVAVPLSAATIALWKGDRVGVAELAFESLLTVGTVYALRSIVKEERPNGDNYQSFPSLTTAVSASGSAFLTARYGLSWGLPAGALSSFASWSTTQAREHRWYDTLASSAIAAGYSFALVPRLKRKYNIDTTLEASPDGGAVRVSYNW